MRPRRWSTRSSRWSSWCAPRASASISCTQNPIDIPDAVLSQLSNRVQHALRAYTPRDQKAVRGRGRDVPRQPGVRHRGGRSPSSRVGEALVSVLEDKGVPSIVERTFIRPPFSRVGPITPEERKAVMAASPVGAVYDKVEDRESAYEVLTKKAKQKVDAEAAPSGPRRRRRQRPPRPTYEDAQLSLRPAALSRRQRPAAGAAHLDAAMRRRSRDEVGGAQHGDAARPRYRARHPRQPEPRPLMSPDAHPVLGVFASDHGPGDAERATIMSQAGSFLARKGAQLACLAEGGRHPRAAAHQRPHRGRRGDADRRRRLRRAHRP